MPLPTADDACVHLTLQNQNLSVTFPGGAEIAANIPSGSFPGPLDAAKTLLGYVNTALAPLTPVFTLIDIGIALFEFAKKAATLSIPDMVDALVRVAQNADKLLGMVPQLSVPLMILSIVDTVLTMLNGIVTELNVIVNEGAAIVAAKARAVELGNVEMEAMLNCSEENLALQMQSMNDGLAPLNRLLALLNILIGLVPGLSPIPTLTDMGSDASGALTALQTVISTLQTIRDTIPVNP